LGDIFSVVEGLVDVHGVVDHVGLVEELDLGLEDLLIGVKLPLLKELHQWEHKVPVKVGRDARG
jgi:hypothetical protein